MKGNISEQQQPSYWRKSLFLGIIIEAMTRTLKILLAYFKVGFAKHFYYRISILLGIFSRVFGLGFLIFLWSSIYADHQAIGGKTLNQIIVYYLFAYIARIMTNPSIASTIGERIKTGEMQLYLLRPGHILLSFFSMPFSKRIYELVLFLLTLAFLKVTFFSGFALNAGEFNYLGFFIFLIFGIIINFLIASILAASAFWITETGAILYGYTSVSGILSGLLIPIAFFPEWAKNIITYLPFRFTISDPVLVLQRDLAGIDLYLAALYAVCWILSLYFINYYIWQFSVRKFDAVGH